MARRLLGALLAAVVGLLFLGASPAAAHAALTGTDPKDGAVLKEPPAQVTLTFSEGVQLSDDSLRVLDPQGKDAAKGEARHVGGRSATAAVALQSGLPEGTFTVVWKAVSEDSHPVAGAFTFSIGQPSETTVALPSGGGWAETFYDAGRYLAYAGFVVMTGTAVFAGWCGGRNPRLRRLASAGWALLFGATVALLLLRGPYTGEDFGLDSVREVLATKPGAALLSRLLLLGAAAVFLAVLFGTFRADGGSGSPGSDEDSPDGRTEKERRDLAVGLGIGGTVVAAGLAATWAMAEHASAGIQPWLAMPVTALHLLAVAVWLGGLVALAVSLRGGPPVERAVVRRFSTLALGSVTVLVVTGTYQAWRGVGSWDALTSTGYGQLLLVKLGLVAVLVGTAWISRRWVARLGDTAPAAVEEVQPVAVTAGAEGAVPSEAVPADPDRARQLALQQAARDRTRDRRALTADPARFGLRRTVLAETAIAMVLLSVTTVLTGTQPGRAEAEQSTAASGAVQNAGPVSVEIPFDTGGRGGSGTAELTLDPARTGDNTLHVYVTNANGELLDVPELRLAFTLADKKIGPLRTVPEKVDTGHWSATGVQLPAAGDWTVALTVRTSDVDQVTEETKIKIG
ncbi:copper resistance protein CopC [Streptomyces sp. NPDC051940]|uniref:copper resistance CopC/CopD family protein n=1 Tax=Streptomyces sp. NPDC051940 TaxID=3155675 RepID=UPI00342FB525